MDNQNTICCKKDYYCLDLTKFLCAILVMIIHIAPMGRSGPGSWAYYVNFGLQNWLARIAVPFFFIASGFFLFRRIPTQPFQLQPIKRYVLRILRLYLIWSFLYLPLALKKILQSKSSVTDVALVYLRDFVFTGSYTHLWYLNALILAVLLTAFLLYKKVKPGTIVGIATVLYLLGLLGQTWYGLALGLKKAMPGLWQSLTILKKVFVTTRNGLFDGFIFVAIGMFFTRKGVLVEKKIAWRGFLLSMLLLFFEAFLLEKYGQPREHDMYLCLLPASFFLFSYVLQVELPDHHDLFITLRAVSSLVFLLHLWVRYLLDHLLTAIDPALATTPLRFVLNLCASVICAYGVYRISQRKKLHWLKVLYG